LRSRSSWCSSLSPPWPAQAPARSHDLTRGKVLFVQYCSGLSWRGRRGEAKTFRPNVGNLSVKELMDQLSDEYLFAAIQKGAPPSARTRPCRPGVRGLGDDEIWDIVAFVRTLSQR